MGGDASGMAAVRGTYRLAQGRQSQEEDSVGKVTFLIGHMKSSNVHVLRRRHEKHVIRSTFKQEGLGQAGARHTIQASPDRNQWA